MKNLSDNIKEIQQYIEKNGIVSVSFDIDGTLYPMKKIEQRWWKQFFISPIKATRFLSIRKRWEKKRKGDQTITVSEVEIEFFENFLASLIDSSLLDPQVYKLLSSLQGQQQTIFFLSDHGAERKLERLNLISLGTPINCLGETRELKPHLKIAELFRSKYQINPAKHLHLGDRWSDQEQAKLLGSHFLFLAP